MAKENASPLPSGRKVGIQLSFPKAMEAIIGGRKVRRMEWAEESEYCLLQESFLMIHRNDKFHGWTVSEGDMLATDWVIVK